MGCSDPSSQRRKYINTTASKEFTPFRICLASAHSAWISITGIDDKYIECRRVKVTTSFREKIQFSWATDNQSFFFFFQRLNTKQFTEVRHLPSSVLGLKPLNLWGLVSLGISLEWHMREKQESSGGRSRQCGINSAEYKAEKEDIYIFQNCLNKSHSVYQNRKIWQALLAIWGFWKYIRNMWSCVWLNIIKTVCKPLGELLAKIS